jgi:hypothetical protein
MADQAEGLRNRRKDAHVLSVISLPGLPASAGVARGLIGAWARLGAASPLLIDGSGNSARNLLGCHPLHEWHSSSAKSFKDCILAHQGKAAVVAQACLAGDARVVEEAARQGYRELVFDAGEMSADEAPIDASAVQDLLFLATPEHLEMTYALLKGLNQAQSPARVWLLWSREWNEAKRLERSCKLKLYRAPFFLDKPVLSRNNHAFERSCLSMPLQDNDFLVIVTKMIQQQSVRGEETSNRTKRHV